MQFRLNNLYKWLRLLILLTLLPAPLGFWLNDTAADDTKRWVLKETLVNPNQAPTAFYAGPGGTPGYYNGARYEGKFRVYTVSPTGISVHDKHMDHEYLEYDVNLSSSFSQPPAELIPGQTVEMEVNFSHSGTVNLGAPSLLFQYWRDGSPIDPPHAYGYAPWSDGFDGVSSTTYSFEVPHANQGTLQIQAGWWNCAACDVRWNYEAQSGGSAGPNPLKLTYPAGPSPKVFAKGWVFGAECNYQGRDCSADVQWGGTGIFTPDRGPLSRPAFHDVGANKIELEVAIDGQTFKKTYDVQAVSPNYYARVSDIAAIAADGHGCPACAHPAQGPIIMGSPNVKLDGLHAARVGDWGIHVACCGPNMFRIGDDFKNPTIYQKDVMIDGRPAAKKGDQTAHCGGMGKIVTGSATWNANYNALMLSSLKILDPAQPDASVYCDLELLLDGFDPVTFSVGRVELSERRGEAGATFNFATNRLHLPNIYLGGTKTYQAEMELKADSGIYFELTSINENRPASDPRRDNVRPVSNSDLWDMTSGTVITGTSGMLADAPAANIFQDGLARFKDGQPAGTTHWIEWQTPQPVTVGSLNLVAKHGATIKDRGFSIFNLYYGDGSGGWLAACLHATNLDGEQSYGGGPIRTGPEWLETAIYLTPFRSQTFRAEFVQAGATGPQVFHLDAYPPVPAYAAPVLYVPNQMSDSVSVVDGRSFALIDTLRVGREPYGVAVSPDAKTVYITNLEGDTVSVIDTARQQVTRTIPVGDYPFGVAFSPDGARAYVANGGDNNLAVIDTAPGLVTAHIAVGQDPHGVAVHPNGTRLYVSNYSDASVSVVDAASRAQIKVIPVGDGPHGITIHPSGAYVYVANVFSDSLSIISTASNQVIKTLNMGKNPFVVIIDRAGKYLYVSNGGSNTVTVVDAASQAVVDHIPVGLVPHGLSIDAAGSLVSVANEGGNNLSIIDTVSRSVTRTVPTGSKPVAFGTFVAEP